MAGSLNIKWGLLLLALGMFAGSATAQDSIKVMELTKRAENAAAAGNTYGAIKIHLDIMDLDAGNYRSANALAGLYGHLHEFTEQIKWAQQAIAINPKYAVAYITLGNGYGATGNVEEAEASYKKAEELMPDSPFPPYCIGVVEENQGRARDAIINYKRSVDRDSLFVDGYCGLAVCYATLQDYTTAQKYIEQALAIDPKSPKALEIKGRIADAAAHP